MTMRRRRVSWKILGFFILMFLLAGSAAVQSTAVEVQAAAKNGWVKQNDIWYYYKNNKKVKGDWVFYNSKYYYLKPKNGAMAENELVTAKPDGLQYYLGQDGVMVTGWQQIDGDWYYFNKSKTPGSMRYGWLTEKNSAGEKKKYFLDKTTGIMHANELLKVGKKYYYATENGSLLVGWKTIDSKRYYFTLTGTYKAWQQIGNDWYYFEDEGYVKTGWLTYNGDKYYLSKKAKNKGARLTGTQTISNKTYHFDSTGILEYEVNESDATIDQPGEAHTIKNFLLGALQPVGKTLYVWGGGWAQPTATYIGVYPEWVTWFNSKGSSYNYANFMDLSVATRAKGLDCSGFVGWSTYQVMETQSGVGSGYVAEASTIASVYASRGYGALWSQSKLSQSNYLGRFKAGDVGSMSGHTFIVIGQCSDGSLVIVHSTPPCVQINGTTTPSGGYDSEAVELAKQYMNQYYPSLVKKFNLSCSVGSSYIRASNILRWNAKTLSDPDGYKTKSAGQVLENMFSGSE